MTHPTIARTYRHVLLCLFMGFCLVLAASALQASDFESQDLYFLTKTLAEEGVSVQDIADKIEPALLAKFEADAEASVLKGVEAPADRSIIVNLRVDRRRHSRLLAEKSGEGRAAIKSEVRDVQNRVLRAVTTKDRRGFELRNRYSILAGFSARADYRAVAALALQGDVEFIQEMMSFETQALLDSNADTATDTRFAHNLATGHGDTIAVIDSGIIRKHDLLGDANYPNSKVIGGYDFGDDDSDPTIACSDNGHGTAVSFIAGGDGGVAPDAKLVHLKVQTDSVCGGTSMDGDIPGAIDWAVNHKNQLGIKIISISIGTNATFSTSCSNNGSDAYRQALDDAEAAGILVVAASANDNDKNGMSFPACYPTVMSVGAVYDKNFGDTRRFYDHLGNLLCKDKKPKRYEVTCYSNSSQFLDVLAPADCAKTAGSSGPSKIRNCFNGPSAAAPFVAGVAALALEENPSLTPANLREIVSSVGQGTTDPENGLHRRVVNSNLSVVGASWWPW
ncbi:MAG: S8 family serine peptidase [Acidobacteriota bacterium]